MTDSKKVKKNKYTIVTIMMKQIASEARERHPELYVEAHPAPGVNQAMLNIRRLKTNTKLIINIKPSSCLNGSWVNAASLDTNDFTAYLEFYHGNKVSRKEVPTPFSFSLDDPAGVVSFENWIESHITGWFYADTPEAGAQTKPVDHHNGSATL